MTIKRELWKLGRRVVAYIDHREEKGIVYYYVVFGKPSDTCVISWRHKNYQMAFEHAMTAFQNAKPTITVVP